MLSETEIRKEIENKITEYFKARKDSDRFIPGKDVVQYAGSVFDEREVKNMVNSILDGWFGISEWGRKFEEKFTAFLGTKKSVLTNSGSSANLIAVSALLSPTIKNRISVGDEVITPALTFPTTFNPLIQNGLKPVILDADLGTYNMNIESIEKAITNKTRLIMIPHTLGNPNDMYRIMELANENDIYVIEDNCDALGSEINGKKTGSFGIMSTCSFYPSHHITMGEGGIISINTDDISLYRAVKSIRDWGRACYCEHDERGSFGACGVRFDYNLDGVNYDHKYMYTHIGYNLKPLEFQAAMGIVQLDRLPEFIKSRKRNFKTLYDEFLKYEDFFILPETNDGANSSWFSFPLTIRDGTPFKRKDIMRFLEMNKIQVRLLFSGNITRQPAYRDVKYRIFDGLTNTDKVMKDSFFIGVYPGITEEKMTYMLAKIREFINKYK